MAMQRARRLVYLSLIFFLAQFALHSPPARAGEPRVVWEKTIGGPLNDLPLALAALPNGELAIAGTSRTDDWEESTLWVARLDGEGNVVWRKSFPDPRHAAHATNTAMRILPDGSLVVAGIDMQKGFWYRRLSIEGELIGEWLYEDRKIFPRPTILDDGSVVIVGGNRLYNEFEGQVRFWVVDILRFTPQGKLAWSQRQAKYESDYAGAVTSLPNGNLAIIGHSYLTETRSKNFWLFILDGTGKFLWDKWTPMEKDFRDSNAIVPLMKGGFAVSLKSNNDIQILRMDAAGRPLWRRKYIGPSAPSGDGLPGFIQEMKDGGFLVSVRGTIDLQNFDDKDFTIHRVDGDGELLWSRSFERSRKDWNNAITVLTDGNIVVAGSRGAGGPDLSDVWIVKLAEE
jgi:hypothetical protein